MASIEKLLVAHPLDEKPYHCIKFVRFDGYGTPLYRVSGDDKHVGALTALKIALERHGAHCYHCGKWHAPQPVSQTCNRDHLRPKARGGKDYLHNLVFACGDCNRAKGASDLASFNVERSEKYQHALDNHLSRCIAALSSRGT